jgi:8-oxoguanine deaminase
MTDGTNQQRTLVKGAAHLMTGLRGNAARATGGTDIRIQGGVIQAIGTFTCEPDEQLIDAQHCVVYPGWVNTHHHLFQSLLKGIPAGINLPLPAWLAAIPMFYRRFFDREEVLRVAVRIGLAELMLSGCTTIADHQYHNYPGMPFDASAIVFEEAEKLSVRIVLCRGGGTLARTPQHEVMPAQIVPETLDQFLAAIAHDANRFHDPSPQAMRKVVSATTTPNWSCKPDELIIMAEQARSLGIYLHSHLSETYDYVKWAKEVHHCTPFQFVADRQWVGSDVWFAHMVHLNDDELRLCSQTKTGIAHCPQSNGRLGSGIARIPEALALGVPIGLAVDGAASNEAADMISEAHACWLTHRADPRAAGRLSGGSHQGGDPAALTVEDVIHIGTAGGARMMGLHGVGTLEVGQAADLAIYELDEPRYFGLHDLAIAPVASGGCPRIRALISNGKVVVKNHQIIGLDLDELRVKARTMVDWIKQ